MHIIRLINRTILKTRRLSISLILLGGLINSVAAQSLSGCPAEQGRFGSAAFTSPNRQNAPIWASADDFDLSQLNQSTLRGAVEFERADQRLQTNLLILDRENQQLTIPGQLNYQDATLELDADRAVYYLNLESGEFENVLYRLVGTNGNGSAALAVLDNQSRTELEDIAYTTCEGEDPEWLLTANQLVLNHEQGFGTVKGAKLTLSNIPILYLPWMTFPIDERRKTGFLYPLLGSVNDNGLIIGAPWYWNIAPNQDATLTPTLISDRGFMLGSEYRFLTRRFGGQLQLEYLPDDNKFDADRYHYRSRIQANLASNWNSRLDYHRVSDDNYYIDFGDGLYETSRQFLRSQWQLNGFGELWTFNVTADSYQVLDDAIAEADEPYRRLPRMRYRFETPLALPGFNFKLDSELVNFDRDTGITGLRLDVLPELSWRWENQWGYAEPAVAYRFTQYELEGTPSFTDDSPNRNLPIASFDAGLFFDRHLKDGGLQVLEPRLFYLYVPEEDQTNLPDFDTAELTFGFSQLFHYNRFTGADRQGDENRLTLALSGHHYDADYSQEKWYFNVGQMFFFSDREVQLNNTTPATTGTSAFIAEVGWRPMDAVLARVGLQWDWDDSEVDLGVVGLDYFGKKGRRVAFDYRFRRDQVDQFDLRLTWPINERWRVLSRWNYSLEDDDTLEALAGFEYESCCWAVRLMGRRYLKNRVGESRDAIYLEMELKGLGNFGRRPYELFNRDEF